MKNEVFKYRWKRALQSFPTTAGLQSKAEIADAVNLKSGGTLSKLLGNLKESGIIREYPRYGKQRVETVYQLKDFFSLFYLRFIMGKQPQKGQWNTTHRTPIFYTWAGDTFELLDLLIESKSSRTDYVCEMKFTGGKYVITQQDEEDILNKMDAFSASKMHNNTHSIQLVLVTTMGVAKGEHSSIVNQTIVMDELFK